MAWYVWMQNDVLATGIMSFIMHEVVYFGRCVPFIIADQIPYFRKYKLQNVGALIPHRVSLASTSRACPT